MFISKAEYVDPLDTKLRDLSDRSKTIFWFFDALTKGLILDIVPSSALLIMTNFLFSISILFNASFILSLVNGKT